MLSQTVGVKPKTDDRFQRKPDDLEEPSDKTP